MRKSILTIICILSANAAFASHGFWNLFEPNTAVKTRGGLAIEARLERFTDGSALVWSPFLYLNGKPRILKHSDSTGEEICRLFVPGSNYMGATIQANPLSPKIANSFGAHEVIGLDSNGRVTEIEMNQWGFYGVRCQIPLTNEMKQLRITSIVSRQGEHLLAVKTPWTEVRGTRVFLGADTDTATGLCALYGYKRAADFDENSSEKSDLYVTLTDRGAVKSVSNFRLDARVLKLSKSKFEISSTPEAHIQELTCWK